MLNNNAAMATANDVLINNENSLTDTKDKPSSSKYYAVAKGHQPGIYDNWSLAEKQVYRYSGQCFKGFPTLSEAEEFMQARSETYPPQYYIKDMTPSTPSFNSTMNSFSQSIADNDTKPSNSTDCMNCSKLEKLVSQLTARISKVELQLKTNYDMYMSSTSSRLVELDGKISNMSLQLAKVVEARQTYANACAAQQTSPEHNTTQSTLLAKSPQANQNVHNFINRNIANQHKPVTRGPQFQPEKCIVVSSNNIDSNSDQFKHTKQDTIRRTLCNNHGPLIIDLINRYRFNSSNPRFIIQFDSIETATKIAQEWKSDSFGGSAVRTTINPNDISAHIGMVKGVPRDIPEKEIHDAICTKYSDATFIRLTKDQQPLRTLKVLFKSKSELDHAVVNGLLVSSQNMIFRVEPAYTNTQSTVNRNVH